MQLGFVAGTLVSALGNLPDVFSTRRLFAISAWLGAAVNAGLALSARGPGSAVALRFLTGFFLAGVYPPGMKIMATWFRRGRGMALGVLVGALTRGSRRDGGRRAAALRPQERQGGKCGLTAGAERRRLPPAKESAMFLGHFGLGFAGKKAAPALSLGALFLAVQWADLLFFLLALAGVEHFRIAEGATAVTPFDFYDYPWSHSLAALAIWGLVLGSGFLFRRQRVAAIVFGLGIVSHWFLDAFVHRPDMPILAGGPYVGLGLWNSFPLTIAAEAVVFGLGLVIYLKTTRALNRTGTWALWSLVAFLVVIWAASIAGPPPPSERVAEWVGLAMWLFVPWGYWIDRHRAIVGARRQA